MAAQNVAQVWSPQEFRDAVTAIRSLEFKYGVTFRDPATIIELAYRSGHPMNLEGRQALNMGINNGRGGGTLKLTQDQYAKLRVQ